MGGSKNNPNRGSNRTNRRR